MTWQVPRSPAKSFLYRFGPMPSFRDPEIEEETSQDWCGRCPPGTVTEATATCVGCSRPLCAEHDEGYSDGYDEYHACQSCAAMISEEA